MANTEKSLRDMDFEEVSVKYESIFGGIIGIDIFNRINEEYRQKYKKFIVHKNKGYDSPSAMGRDKTAYGRNIIYGWFCEDLVIESLRKNREIKKVELFGKDKNHDFSYNDKNKKITIDGSKSTDPDIEMILSNGNRFLLELKTANKNVFTIKKGNIENLYVSVANHDAFCLIMMLDLSKGLFDIRDLTFFDNQRPFPNANMEGQICYNFPVPSYDITNIGKISINDFANMLMMENEWVKKFKLLRIAIENNNKKWQIIIKNKIKIEKMEEEMELNTNQIKDKIRGIIDKTPEVKMNWKDITKQVESFK